MRRRANAKMVAKALEDSHIRMFGLALGPVETKSKVTRGTMTSTTSQGPARTEPLVGEFVYNTGDENFFPLTANSGGLVLSVMNADPRRTWRSTTRYRSMRSRCLSSIPTNWDLAKGHGLNGSLAAPNHSRFILGCTTLFLFDFDRDLLHVNGQRRFEYSSTGIPCLHRYGMSSAG